MESDEQYGPALPPGIAASSSSSGPVEHFQSKKFPIGPALPPGMQKSSDSDDLSDEGPLTVKMDPEVSPDYSAQEGDDNEETVGPLPSEMSHEGDAAGHAADEFERRSKRMKDKLTIKAEAEEGPSKREEWMTELPPDMGKNFGLQNRTFSNKGGASEESKDRSAWTDTPVKKEKDLQGKGKKRKRDDEKVVSARDQQLQQQVEEYNTSKRPESLLEMHSKKLKKKKGTAQANTSAADSTQQQQPGVVSTTAGPTPTSQQAAPLQQYYQLTDEIRDSIDMLSEQQKTQQEATVAAAAAQQFYQGEFAQASAGPEFTENKPLQDLLINPSMVTYSQDGTATFTPQAAAPGQQATFNSSQMIAQAYSHAQQMSVVTAPAFSQVATNTFTQAIPAQNVVCSSQTQEVANAAAAAATVQANGQTIDVSGQQQQQLVQQQVHTYSDAAYAGQVSGEAVQQGQVVTFSLAGGQNMIIASPHTQQAAAGQNYVISSQGAQPGQNIVIAAPSHGQGASMQGNYIVKTEGDELGQNIVLTQQNIQQALGQNVVLTQDGQIATATGENVVLAAADGTQQRAQQQQHAISAATAPRQIQPAAQAPQQQVLTQAGIPIQTAGGAQIPQVSLVLPQVNSLFPQIQQQAPQPVPTVAAPTQSAVNPQSFLQLCTKVDRMITMVKDSQKVLMEMNSRVERIESHLFPQTPIKGQKSSKQIRPNVPVASSSSAASSSKANLKASLSSYLTISDYTATDELKRSDSNSDLFIPVGTVSMVHGQAVMQPPSPSETPETASSTVSELPTEQELLPVVLNSMGQPVTQGQNTDINVPIVDSQSGIAVTVYDEGNEGQKYELGPGSSKEPNARFSNTSGTPKTVILDPRFWEILVEDFQKNMSSDQIISAMSSTRKPLVRSIGNSEISICSTVLKEAESACQGRRERLAKELVFRIFTLGEVYDRNVSGVFYINGKKMENKNKALDPAKMAAIHYLVMKYPPSVVDNPRLERLVWKNCVDRINDALRRIYNWIHKIVDVNNIMDKLPTDTIMMH